MSKEEQVMLRLKTAITNKNYSAILNDYRVGGIKWNDINDNNCLYFEIDLNKEDLLVALCVKQTIADLETKLAEKEKEIEEMQKSSDKNIDYLVEFACLIENEEDCNRMLKALERVKRSKKYIVDKEYQDKIDYAVEQLEKAKELINNKLEFMWQNNAEMTCRDRHIIEKCYEDIDQLITEIKEGK